jgi:hypothetical protein
MGKSCCGGCFFGKFRNNILLEIRTENNIKRGEFYNEKYSDFATGERQHGELSDAP